MESLRYLYRIGRGPSSSHTMAPFKAAYILRKHYEDNIKSVKVTLYGSLAFTGKGHLTDQVIKEAFNDIPTEVVFDYKTEKEFPNTMVFEITLNSGDTKKHIALSIGGGAISIDGKNGDDGIEVYRENSYDEIKAFCKAKNISLQEYVYQNEGPEIKEYLYKIYQVMMDTIERGLNTQGELPGSLHVKRKASYFHQNEDSNSLPFDETYRLLQSYAFASAEENASGGVVVTAPTCGSCGVVPATIKYFSETLHSSKEEIIDALAVAGLIGNLVKRNGSISGAEAGCQAEIGTATAMASAALSTLQGLSIDQIECASEIAIEHSLGLTCDPIEGYVQIPCIERNAVATLNAIAAYSISKSVSSMHTISLDEAIKTALETGRDMNSRYKETSQGGLADIHIKSMK